MYKWPSYIVVTGKGCCTKNKNRDAQYNGTISVNITDLLVLTDVGFFKYSMLITLITFC